MNKHKKIINKLYYFIQHLAHAPLTWETKRSKYNCDYLLGSLPLTSLESVCISGRQFSIFENHLSVYSVKEPHDYRFSEYHYTAQMHCVKSGNIHKLHVYFDEDDAIKYIEIVDSKTKAVVTCTMSDVLPLVTHAQQVMLDIKEQRRVSYLQLKGEYQQRIGQLSILSSNLSQNQEKWRAGVGELVVFLTDACDLHESTEFTSWLSLFTNIAKAKFQHSQEQEEPIRVLSGEHTCEFEASEADSAVAAVVMQESQYDRLLSHLMTVEDFLNQHKTLFAANGGSDVQKVEKLVMYHELLQERNDFLVEVRGEEMTKAVRAQCRVYDQQYIAWRSQLLNNLVAQGSYASLE